MKFSEMRRTAAYDQQRSKTEDLLREAVWVYRQSLVDEGSELKAMDYMAQNFAHKVYQGSGGDLDETAKTLATWLAYAVQMLSGHIGEVE